ncbi:MAG: hypothetical protein ACI4RU_00125, partial [Acutalibacteraceae bacterium]
MIFLYITSITVKIRLSSITFKKVILAAALTVSSTSVMFSASVRALLNSIIQQEIIKETSKKKAKKRLSEENEKTFH